MALNKQKEFSKEITLITKGVLIMMLLYHHLFCNENIVQYNVIMFSQNLGFVHNISYYCKVCIAVFAFLSAFGMTRAYMKTENMTAKGYTKAMLKRLVKLESSICFVYCVVILYKKFIMHGAIAEHYRSSFIIKLADMIIDMLGLYRFFETGTINVTWWYMSFAVLEIFAMPIFYMVYKKCRYTLVPIGVCIPLIYQGEGEWFVRFIPSIILGIFFAYENVFETLKKWGQGDIKRKLLKIMVCFLGIWWTYIFCRVTRIEYAYPLCSVIYPYLAYEILADIPVMNKFLGFLGKHATNIFLIHTFIFLYFYTDFIYSFKYGILIWLVLLGLTLMISIALEQVKKIIGYNRLINYFVLKIDRWV